MERNETFLQKAEELKPTLHMRRVSVSGSETPLKKGGSLTLDFGEHLVGTVMIRLAFVGSHPDAPACFGKRGGLPRLDQRILGAAGADPCGCAAL